MDEETDDEVPMAISLGVDWFTIALQTNQTIVPNLSCEIRRLSCWTPEFPSSPSGCHAVSTCDPDHRYHKTCYFATLVFVQPEGC